MNSVKLVASATFLLLVASFPAAADEVDPSPPPPPPAEDDAAPVDAPAATAGPEGEAIAEAVKESSEAAAEVAVAPDAPAAAPKKKAPWRGTSLSYSHATSAISLNKGAEPNWNPYYGHRLSIRPEWHFGEQLYLRANIDLGQELTTADDTNRKNELVLGDAVLDIGAAGVKDPLLGVQFSGSLRLGGGLSKVSRAQTKVATIGPGVSVARRFGVLNGLSVRYDARYTERLHRSTTTLYEEPTLAFCDGRDLAACAEYAHSGVRNTQRDVSQSFGLGFSPHDRVSLSASFLLNHGFLYPLTAEPRYGLPAEQGQSTRYAWGFNLGGTVRIFRELSLTVGSSTFSPQLTPESTRRSPFFNRFTNLYVDLGLDLEALLQRL